MPNASSLAAIQTTIAAILVADSTLTDLVGGVANIYNYEPEEPPPTFIVVGSATEQGWHTLGGVNSGWGWDVNLTIHLFSYYKGDLVALQMLSRVTSLLNFATLTVAGYATVICEYAEDRDTKTRVLIETKDKQERRHIPAVFSIKVHE